MTGVFVFALLLAAALSPASAQERVSPSAHSAPRELPPAVRREFRGVWLVTVGNSDWPSRPGLSTWEQQQELLALLNRAVELKLNAVLFHVRTGADAFYDSPYEPWSQFITGVQGRAPEPAWDPLAFAVAKAHERGLELHAWFNPYKAHYTKDTAVAARNHVVRQRPDIVYPYGRFVWMDPGILEVRRRALRAIMDVVRRYDVDGVHIDDFFYPYPEKDSSGGTINFPDSATYARYRRGGGTLAKDDWRRRNVDLFIEGLYHGVKRLKPWVKVGISPFGIWRPGTPAQIKGFDAYAQIYADSKKWLERGWLDYFTPQLYWAIDPPQQSYPVLLDWWLAQNPAHRHIWPGLYTGRVGANTATVWPAEEIVRQVELTRERAGKGATGNVHFPMKVFVSDPDSLDEKLGTLYADRALVPASPWLDAQAPGRPAIRVVTDAATGDKIVTLAPTKGQPVWLWTVRTRAGAAWTTEILPGAERKHRLASGDSASEVYVTAVGRTGNESRFAQTTIH
jgi:uncharacterized lipoprotein YddW (UPF0748 family)